MKHLEVLDTKLEDHFGSAPEQGLLRTVVCQRAFKMVMSQLLKEEVSKIVPYNLFEQKKDLSLDGFLLSQGGE